MSTQFGDTKRTLSTGDLVISVSEIFDRLQSKVDPNTLDQLLRDIISGRRDRVRPGELITAELINQMLAELESLETRVTKLEAGGTGPSPSTPVDITDLLPHGPLHVGDELTIVGKNFVEPAENNTVSVAGVPIGPSLFRFSSDDTHLIFPIPPVPNLASMSQPVRLEVRNKNGSDSASLTLLPAFNPPTGRLEVAYAVAPVMPELPPEARRIQANTAYVFTFSITAFVTADAADVTYEVRPAMAGWNARLLRDSGDQPRENNLITIPTGLSGVRREIRVQVTPPTGAGRASLQMDVVEQRGLGRITPGSAIVEMAVGELPPTPENRVRVSVKSIEPLPARMIGNKAQWQRGEPAALTFVLAFIARGRYSAAVEFRQASGWRAPDGGAPRLTISNFEVQDDTTPESPARFESILILTPEAGAAETDLILTVSSTSGVTTPLNVKYAQAVSVVD